MFEAVTEVQGLFTRWLRFSGVTEEDLENTTISLRDVQAVLLSMFSAESILIGHSLESDLLALKVKLIILTTIIQIYIVMSL